MKHLYFLFLALILFGCSSPLITTQWECKRGAKIRIISQFALVSETTLPATLKLNSSMNYFVEIMTPQSDHIFGNLLVFSGTQLTELSNVKIDINNSIIKRVLDNQVSQITVRDPSADANIIVLNLGNKMPSEMSDIYDDLKIQPY